MQVVTQGNAICGENKEESLMLSGKHERQGHRNREHMHFRRWGLCDMVAACFAAELLCPASSEDWSYSRQPRQQQRLYQHSHLKLSHHSLGSLPSHWLPRLLVLTAAAKPYTTLPFKLLLL
jgi:hypothetical protein